MLYVLSKSLESNLTNVYKMFKGQVDRSVKESKPYISPFQMTNARRAVLSSLYVEDVQETDATRVIFYFIAIPIERELATLVKAIALVARNGRDCELVFYDVFDKSKVALSPAKWKGQLEFACTRLVANLCEAFRIDEDSVLPDLTVAQWVDCGGDLARKVHKRNNRWEMWLPVP